MCVGEDIPVAEALAVLQVRAFNLTAALVKKEGKTTTVDRRHRPLSCLPVLVSKNGDGVQDGKRDAARRS